MLYKYFYSNRLISGLLLCEYRSELSDTGCVRLGKSRTYYAYFFTWVASEKIRIIAE